MAGVRGGGRRHLADSSVLSVLADPLPLYLVAAAMAGYNVLFYLAARRTSAGEGNVERKHLSADVCSI